MRILFVVHQFRNVVQAQAQVARLASLHPNDSVILIDDEAEHLATGGLWTVRWLTRFLATDADICIKVDPDVAVNNAIKTIPPGDMFGAMGNRVFGLAQGITREAARKILDSFMLADQKYTDTIYAYQWRDTQRPCQDAIMQDICARLGLKVVEWSEVFFHPWCTTQHPEKFTFVGRV